MEEFLFIAGALIHLRSQCCPADTKLLTSDLLLTRKKASNNVDINNVRQHRNNVVFFNVEFHNVDQRRNNVVTMTICKKFKRAKKIFLTKKKRKKIRN